MTEDDPEKIPIDGVLDLHVIILVPLAFILNVE